VDQVKTDVSQVIDENQINNLPINGRRVDQFVLLTPGVTPDGTFGDISFRGVPGGNNFLIDGNDTTDSFYGENAGRTRIQTQISQDAVQEFQVLSDGYSAEYGRAIGGVINTVTRSGTNDFHASGFWFFRNRTLDARDPFASINPPEVRNQFGGNLSGPIIKNKLYFFLNTEEQLRNFPLISSLISPSAISGTGSSAVWKNCGVSNLGTPAATPVECRAINALLPQFFTSIPRTADQQTALGKIDWRPNDRNSFSFDLNYVHFNSPNGIQTGAVVTTGGALNSNGVDDVNVRTGRADWIFVPGSSIVNEARFGWFKDRQADALNNALLPATGTISLSVAGASIGAPNYLPRVAPSENRYEFADNLSYTTGRHSLKFGVDYLNTEDYYNELNSANGSYSFANANAFALAYAGVPGYTTDYTSFTQAFGNAIVDTDVNEVDAYAQDQYRIRPNLTLYYGVRYEKNFIPQPPSQYVNSAFPQTGRIPQDNLDLAPRIGFAWALNGGKTVVRSGYGIMYGRYSTSALNTLFSSNNNYTSTYTLQPGSTSVSLLPSYPNILPSAAGLVAAGAATIEFASPNLRAPYTEQADFAIQQAINKNTSLTTSYLWDRGARLFTVRDLNQPDVPPTDVTYSILSSQGGPVIGTFTTPVYLAANRINPAFNRVLQLENGGNSYYSGLAVQLVHRMSHGFEANIDYTWSHAIDNNLGGSSNFTYLSGVSSDLYNGNYSNVKGSSSLDQRQRLVINWVWSPNFSHSGSYVTKYFLNGWQLSAITTIATGLPYTETLSVLSNYPGLEATGSLTGFGGSTQVPFLGVNTLRLNDTTRVDARLSKDLAILEHLRARLQFEVFNLTNTIVYTSASSTGYYATWTGSAATGKGTIYPAPGLGTPTASTGFPDGTNARRAQASLRLDF
jgi:outer membrane receptor protein involved in Fe transport